MAFSGTVTSPGVVPTWPVLVTYVAPEGSLVMSIVSVLPVMMLAQDEASRVSPIKQMELWRIDSYGYWGERGTLYRRVCFESREMYARCIFVGKLRGAAGVAGLDEGV